MSRKREVVLALLGLALIVAARYTVDGVPHRDTTLEAGTCRVPVSIFDATGKRSGSAILLHGLSANRRTMSVIAQALAAFGVTAYALDLPGHGDNTEPFSFERVEECARAAVGELARNGEIELHRTMLVGHSMGGGIAIRMADYTETAATVAISPAPLVPMDTPLRRALPYQVPAKRPANLLALSAEYEPFKLKQATQELARRMGPLTAASESFTNGAALEWREIPRATHVSLLLDPRAILDTVTWAGSSGVAGEHSAFVVVHFLPLVALPFAILLLFPTAASATCWAFGYNCALDVSEGSGRNGIAPVRIAVAWAVACVLTVLILWLWVPLRFVHLYTGDYLASFFLISSATLIASRAVILRPSEQDGRRISIVNAVTTFDPRAAAAGAAVGIVTFLAVGWWLNTQWYDAWMNAARWWRFAVLVPLLLPYFWAEELALDKIGEGTPARRYSSLQRWGVFLLLRTIAWTAMAAALWVLDSGQILNVLMVMFFLLFSVLQRAGANAVARRAGRPAAAVFSAILAAWFIAAVFPLT